MSKEEAQQKARDLVEAYEHGLSEMDEAKPASVLIEMIARSLRESWQAGYDAGFDFGARGSI